MNIPEIKINPAEESEIEITGELPVTDFVVYRAKALDRLNNDIKVAGFRPGHVPEKVIVDQVGEDKILWEMAEQAIADLYVAILNEKKILAIGRPEITITKIAQDNPLGFKIKTAVIPEIKIADYKEIAKKINSQTLEPVKEITNEEVDKIFEEVKKEHAGHNHSDEELKAKIKANLELEKKAKAQDKKRVGIVQEVIKESEIKIPKLLIENEKDKMLAEMEAQIGYMGLKFDDYLTHLKKTREELRGAWSKEARERVAFGLVLNEIAKLEKISAPEDELKREVDYLKNQYKDVAEDRLRSYAAGLIVNEKVFEFLESIK